jgi:hypothetical protein
MPVMTGAGIRDPENPDQWLVAPWPADASFRDVLQHFHQVCTQFDADTSNARLLAFHEGLYAALAAAPTGQFAEQTQGDWRTYVLNCADLGVRIFRDLAIIHVRDPQAAEDQHVRAVQGRNNPQTPPGP